MISDRVLEQAMLERLRFGRDFILGPFARDTMHADLTAHAIDEIATRISFEVLAGKVADETQTATVHHPASWWQHLKLSLPASWRKRWPVRMTTTTVTIRVGTYDTYPHAGVSAAWSDLVGYPVPSCIMEFEAQSPWIVAHDPATHPATDGYATRHRLAARLDRMIPPPGSPGNYWITAVPVLEALALLGVNPDRLVTTANLDRLR